MHEEEPLQHNLKKEDGRVKIRHQIVMNVDLQLIDDV
jgi:hypothetical protein